MNSTVLRVQNLRVYYETPQGAVKAVDGVTFDLFADERLGVVGESGSGKSTLALAIMRLNPGEARVVTGQILLKGRDLLGLSEEEIRTVRLAEIALVPQGAMNSLNPVMRIKDQLMDGIQDHMGGMTGREQLARVSQLLELVGLRQNAADMFPHELSGGMKQRVCIAIAVCLQPKVIIADEPTSALDVVVQRQIMEMLGQIQHDIGASILLVGHDMGLMAQFVDRILVMYGGKIAEIGTVTEVFEEPLHPYTQLLIASLPSLSKKQDSRGIPGLPPSLLNPPFGCVFHQRCPRAFERCPKEVPQLREIRPGQWVACHLY